MGARLEDLILSLGRPGKFQLLCVALLSYQYVFFIAYPTSMSFYLLGSANACQNKSSTDFQSTKNSTVDDDDSSEPNEHFVSFAMEWGYLCSDKYIVGILQTSYFLGNMLGGIIFGPIADRFGRKPVAFSTIISAGLIGVATYFTYNIYIFGVLKILQGIVLQGYNSSSNCMKTEMLHNKYRSKVISIADACGLSIPMFYLAGLSLTCHWRYVELGLCIPLLMSFWTVWVVPESLRWLLKAKKRTQALEYIRKTAKYNDITLPDNIEKEVDLIIAEIDDQSKLQRQYDVRDLFRTPRITMYCLIFALSWFAWLLCNYGLMFSMHSLSGNVFINFVIFGVVDLVFRSSAFLSLRLCQTRTLSFIGLFTTGIMLLAIVIAKSIPGLEHLAASVGVAMTTFAIIGRAFIGVFVVSTYLLLSEVFPTPLRATAYGIFAAAGRIGALLSSQVISLGALTWAEFPYVIFGTMAIVSGSLQLILPATKNKPMPNTIEETLKLHLTPANELPLHKAQTEK